MEAAETRRSIDPSSRQYLLTLVLASFGLNLAGCGGPQRAAPVDVAVAEATLLHTLQHWQAGGTIQELREQTPEIVVQEAFWTDGYTLQEFALTGQSREENANWFCDVELTVTPPGGGEPKKRIVTYAVGTDPVLTVFRAML